MHCFILTASCLVAAVTAMSLDGHRLHQLKDRGGGNAQAFDLESLAEATLQAFFDSLAENGFDPFKPVGQQVIDYSLPDGSLELYGVFNGVCISGISNVVIQYVLIPSVLIPPYYAEFELVFPEINITASRTLVDIVYVDESYRVEGGGWIVLQNVTVLASADVSLPISVDTASVGVTIGGIQSNFIGTLNDVNYTDDFNEFINLFLLGFLTDNNSEVNNTLNELLILFLSYIFSSM